MRRISPTHLLLVGLLGWSQPVSAATLRAIVELRGPIVHLSDLFGGLEVGQDCPLGDAPSPGSRLVIEGPQLEAIASQFGVSWEPLQSDQSVTLERSGRALSEATVLSMLKAALAANSNIKNANISLSGFSEPSIDLDAVVDVSDVRTNPAEDRFDAVLTARLDHHETLRLPIQGSVERMVSLPVLARSLTAGEVIEEGDLVLADVSAARVHGEVVERSGDAVGWTSPHGLPSGTPIARSELRRPDIVTRGGAILMRLTSGGIDVAAQGQSLEAGAMAGRVRVLNPVSHAVLMAIVIGPNEVRVDPDSLPTLSSAFFGSGMPSRFGNGATLASNLATRYESPDNRP